MRRILTIKEAAKLIEGLTEYRVRQDVLHLLKSWANAPVSSRVLWRERNI